MDNISAAKLVRETFEKPFDKTCFTNLVSNIFKHLDYSNPYQASGGRIPNAGAFLPYINSLERIGKYQSASTNLDVLVVGLKKEQSLERARTMQRNFIARYLDGFMGGEKKDAALVAFVSPDPVDWRFSLVRMDYSLGKNEKGKTVTLKELTPARRWSFLVGQHESSHTAQSRLIGLLKDDRKLPTLTDLEEAFNVETVTKEFFNKYRELFHNVQEALDKLIKKDQVIAEDFKTRNIDTTNLAKKLLGQIVFLYFLQKKGWMGVPQSKNWGEGDKRFLRSLFEKCRTEKCNFFDDYLQFLFYDALNNQNRGSASNDFYPRFGCKIPFLNGGLFTADYDWKKIKLVIPNHIFSNKTQINPEGDGILDVFDLYNFTVNEDEPLEREVAIDPEMLGKVFENLLEVKDRKSKGTFYTPREIVHYMCQESLINYLDTALNSGEVALGKESPVNLKLFGAPAVQQMSFKTATNTAKVPRKDLEDFIRRGELSQENEEIAERSLEKIEKGEQKTTQFAISFESIRHNAKLIDEALANFRVCDPAIGSGAFPVGMMHEIVRARRLLGTYLKTSKTAYKFKLECIQNCLYGVDIDSGAVEIAKLRLWLSLVVDEESLLNITPLPNLDYKVVRGNSLLGVERNIFNNDLFKELEVKKPLYFKEYDLEKKQTLKKEIDQIITKITNNKKTFDFEIYFSEVFHEKGGFDAVIGNPPYLEARSPEFTDGDKKLIGLATQRRWPTDYQLIMRGSDLLIYFLEIGIYLINKYGNVTLLTHNSWLDTVYGKKFQEFLIKNTHVEKIIDSDFKYFDDKEGPNINTIISVFRGKKPRMDKTISFIRFHENFEIVGSLTGDGNDHDNTLQFVSHTYKYSDKIIKDTKWGILLSSDSSFLKLLEILKGKGSCLEKINTCKLDVGQGLNLTKNFIVSQENIKQFPTLRNAAIPFMTSEDGAKFKLKSTDNYLLDKNRLKSSDKPILKSLGIESFDFKSTKKINPSLILPRGISRHFCAMNNISAYSSSYVEIYNLSMTKNPEIILNLWLFLNSSIAWLLREVSGRKNLGGGLLKAEAVDLNQFPLYFEFNKSGEITNILNLIGEREALETISELDTDEHIKIDKIVFDYLGIEDGFRVTIKDMLKSKITERCKKSKT